MKTLLVAVTPQDGDHASVIAAYQFRIYLAFSMAQAMSTLGCGHIDGVVAGVHFNDGDVFEFLRAVRASPCFSEMPFIVVRAAQGRLHEDSYRAIQMACEHEDVVYLDVVDLVERFGLHAGHAELRRRVQEIVG